MQSHIRFEVSDCLGVCWGDDPMSDPIFQLVLKIDSCHTVLSEVPALCFTDDHQVIVASGVVRLLCSISEFEETAKYVHE